MWTTTRPMQQNNRKVTITVEECENAAGEYYLLTLDEEIYRVDCCDDLHELIADFVDENWC